MPSVTRSIARRSSTICAAGSRTVGRQHAAADQLGVRARRLRARLRSRTRQSAARRGRLSAIRTATARARVCRLSLQDHQHGIPTDCRRRSSSRICATSASTSTCDRTSSRRCMRTSSRAISRCTRCSGSAAPLADPDILRRVFHSQQVPPAGFNRGHFSDPGSRSPDRRSVRARPTTRRAASSTARCSSCSPTPRRTSACGTRRTSRSRSRSSKASASRRRAISRFCETSRA